MLRDNYNDKYWYKVSQQMRENIDEAVNKAVKCSDIKYEFAGYKRVECGESTIYM